MPPSGRMKKLTPNVANANSNARCGSLDGGKNNTLM